MLIDAIVLAGGRSSRLDSVAKAELRYRQQLLVERTVAVVSGTRRVVVVGPAVPVLHEALSATHPRTG